jgi:hypothetical protein
MKKNKKSKGKAKSVVRKAVQRAKEDAAAFLNSEEGKIVKKDIVKAALALGLVAGATTQAIAGHGDGACTHFDTIHADYVTQQLVNPSGGGTGGHYSAHADTGHVDYCAHNDWHASGGWC